MCKFQKQFDYYRRNKSMLLADYNGMVLIIPESLDVKAFPTMEEAYTYGAEKYGMGSFMIQKCTENADAVQSISNIGLRAV